MGNTSSGIGKNSNAGHSSTSGFNLSATPMQSPNMMSYSNPRNQTPPDLSAFDSLLPSSNKSLKSPPMNLMVNNKVS